MIKCYNCKHFITEGEELYVNKKPYCEDCDEVLFVTNTGLSIPVVGVCSNCGKDVKNPERLLYSDGFYVCTNCYTLAED